MTHPILDALSTAGPQAAQIACRITQGAVEWEDALTHLATALTEDHFGCNTLNDRWTAQDRDASPEARKNARARNDWRGQVSDYLNRCDDALRAKIVTGLAAGEGRQLADALRTRADEIARALPQAMAEASTQQKAA